MNFPTKKWTKKMETVFFQSLKVNISEKSQLFKIYMKKSQNDTMPYTIDANIRCCGSAFRRLGAVTLKALSRQWSQCVVIVFTGAQRPNRHWSVWSGAWPVSARSTHMWHVYNSCERHIFVSLQSIIHVCLNQPSIAPGDTCRQRITLVCTRTWSLSDKYNYIAALIPCYAEI